MATPSSTYRIAWILAAVAVILLMGFTFNAASHRFHKEIPSGHEHELKVTLDAGFGDMFISRGGSGLLFDATINSEKDLDVDNVIEYDLRDEVGYLDVNTSDEQKSGSKKHSITFNGFSSNDWDMKFTPTIPISFELNLGLGKGYFDFTGLSVKDLKLSSGASSVSLKFDKPNPTVIENLTIETGLSKFIGEGLGNANFNHLKFEGGVGSYSLSFDGSLRKEVDVDIEVGLGSLTVFVPRDVGTRVIYEKSWITHIDLDKSLTEEQENNYYTSNYSSARGKINLHIEAGLGSVKVRCE